MHLYVGLINNRVIVDSGYLVFDYSVLSTESHNYLII